MPPAPSPGRSGFNSTSFLTGLAIGAVVTVMAAVAVVPAERRDEQDLVGLNSGGVAVPLDSGPGIEDLGAAPDVRSQNAPGGGSAEPSGSEASGSGSGSSAAVGGGANGGGAASAAECAAGRNGGATDTGVTESKIKLGATVAESDFAEAFLGEVRQGMEAVKNKVNRAGGICGRQLEIVYKDDGWDPRRGNEFLENLIQQENIFALAVSPSSEGINFASRSGLFDKTGVPVVGADGLNNTQFIDPQIFPVAAATTTTVHVIMQDAWARGARNPAIVFGNTYRFGVEGAYAFNAAYRRLSGSDIPGYGGPEDTDCGQGSRYCGISAGTGQYQGQVQIVKDACTKEPKCDFLLLLLEPKTAQQWMAVPGVPTSAFFDPGGIGGAQPLFTFDFGKNCGDKCDGMRVWTGYNPPIEQYANQAAVKTYLSDLKAQSPSADEYNQFTIGGYVGMQVLVEALRRAGPNLTRKSLLDTLNGMPPVQTGLAAALQWRPNARYANPAAQAFEIQAKNGFTGWRFVQPPLEDPWLGQDNRAG